MGRKKLHELSEKEYEHLKASGMMWEVFPEATGIYNDDIKVTAEYVISKLISIQEDSDTEQAHIDADELLCRFLSDNGHSAIVEEYNKIEKWYA